MYYYPYLLHLINFLSFRHYNNINEVDIVNFTNANTNTNNANNKVIDLWSISRWSYHKYKGVKTFTASYNYYTHNYEFNDKRYILYDDVVNEALNI
jgi:hypothetical protein